MIEQGIRDLAQGANFAALTTVLPSGLLQSHVMWVDADDDHILINTEIHRQKFRNVARDPRASVMIWDHGNPYVYAEVRGEVVEHIRGDEARTHIDKLARKYIGQDYLESAIQTERVILKIAPRIQHLRQIGRR